MSKRELGKSTQVYILVRGAENKFSILEGQTGLSVNHSNAIEEVSAFKVMGEAAATGASYVESVDGKRQIAISVTTGRPDDPTQRVVQGELLTTLRSKEDTTTIILVGEVAPTTAFFTGTEYEVLVANISNEYPSDSAVTGSMEFTNKGTTKPIAHDGSEVFADIVTAIIARETAA